MGEDSEDLVPDAQPRAEKEPFWRRWVSSLKKLLQWVRKQLKKLHEWLKKSPLLVACLWAIAGALVTFGVLWPFIGFTMHGYWTWGLGPGDTTRADAVRTVLTIIAGIGGIIYLTIAFRRQRGVESADFMNQLENAARQLGSIDPMVQYAGIYALEALADDSKTERKQQCVDILCSYLRLPYQGGGRPSLLREVVEKNSWTDGRRIVEETRTHRLRPADREVRLTIIRTITKHLQEGSLRSWSGLNLDFTGVVFDGGDFSRALFSDGKVKFTGAKFNGGTVKFTGAKFGHGVYADFTDAEFNGGTVEFVLAKFFRGGVDFTDAQFAGAWVDFALAEFSGGKINFLGAQFTGGTVRFTKAEFSGGTVDFREPAAWGAPPLVPWGDGETPDGVLPDQWPPPVAAKRPPIP